MRPVSEPICSKMGPRAGMSASGMCSAALLWKLLAGHLGNLPPKDLTAPRTLGSPAECGSRPKPAGSGGWPCGPGSLLPDALVGRAAPDLVEPDGPGSRHRSRPFCACSSVDEPQLACVGYQYLVAALLQEPANPGRVGSGLYSYAHGPLGGEAPTESLGGGAQPTFFDHLAALGVDKAQVRVPVAQVQSGRRLRSLFANIHGGPILLSIGRKSPYSICRPSKGTAYGGSAFSSHLRRTRLS